MTEPFSSQSWTTFSAPEGVLKKFTHALRSDGDFPVRMRVVNELRRLASDPDTPVQKIADVILRDPSLGARVLHLVNSGYFRGARPVTTISEAVIRLGTRPLIDLCAGLILLQCFLPQAKRGGVFATNLKHNIVTALLTRLLAEQKRLQSEEAFLAGTFFTLGHLLLGYYFPKLYETAAKRAVLRGKNSLASVTELLGFSPAALSISIVTALDIPLVYTQIIRVALDLESDSRAEVTHIARCISVADGLAQILIEAEDKLSVARAITELAQRNEMEPEDLFTATRNVFDAFERHCQSLDLGFLSLPDFLETLQPGNLDTGSVTPVSLNLRAPLLALSQALADGEPFSSILSLSMETMLFHFHCHRISYYALLPEQSQFQLRLTLGDDGEASALGNLLPLPEAAVTPLARSFYEGEITFQSGTQNDDSVAFLPVGLGPRKIGVLALTWKGKILERCKGFKPMQKEIADFLDRSLAQRKH